MQKQVVSKGKNGLQFRNFPLENCVLLNKKVISQSGSRYIPSACLVVRGSFFETVLFLVYENMAPLPKREFKKIEESK